MTVWWSTHRCVLSVCRKAAAVDHSNACFQAVSGRHPPLLVIVTGSGPLKTHYEAAMRTMDLQHVAFRTAWLAAEDYPVLLGSADVGISLHTSSSGLDLPMKVIFLCGHRLCGCILMCWFFYCFSCG